MSPARMGKFEASIRTVLTYSEAYNRHDVNGMVALLGEGCIFENSAPAPEGARYSGKEAISRFWQEFFSESPQAHIDIEDIFGLGEHCVMRWRYGWMDPEGSKGHFRGVDIFRVRGGAIIEQLSYVKG